MSWCDLDLTFDLAVVTLTYKIIISNFYCVHIVILKTVLKLEFHHYISKCNIQTITIMIDHSIYPYVYFFI